MMMCSATPEQWIDFIEGTSLQPERVRMELHLQDCAACRDLHQRLLLTRRSLLNAARTGPVPGNELSRLWHNIRFRIRRFGQPDLAARSTAGLTQLRSILISMCGEAAADGALEKASNLDPHFAQNLSSIVEVMCGTRAARLVEHAAKSAREDKVA